MLKESMPRANAIADSNMRLAGGERSPYRRQREKRRVRRKKKLKRTIYWKISRASQARAIRFRRLACWQDIPSIEAASL